MARHNQGMDRFLTLRLTTYLLSKYPNIYQDVSVLHLPIIKKKLELPDRVCFSPPSLVVQVFEPKYSHIVHTDELRHNHTFSRGSASQPCPPPHQFAPQLCPLFHLWYPRVAPTLFRASSPGGVSVWGAILNTQVMSRLDATSRNHDQFSLLATNLKIYEPVHFNKLATRGASICYQAGKLPEWANATLVSSLSKRHENFRFESLRYDYLWIYNIAYNIHSASFTRANYTTQTGIRRNLTPIIRKITSVLNGANCRLYIGLTRYE